MNPARLPGIRGICYLSKEPEERCIALPSHAQVQKDRTFTPRRS
jgi:hypothetical protein